MEQKWFEQEVLRRFVPYVKICTTSFRNSEVFPSSEGQWVLLKQLKKELEELGIQAELDSNGYLTGRMPANTQKAIPPIGFLAHVDTASDVSGENVNPNIIENYSGSIIRLNEAVVLDPAADRELLRYTGETIITSDGNTLLGADDKAGIAEIMAALRYLKEHPSLEHGELEIIFTPDEETGHGMDLFPIGKLKSRYCYTLDGDGMGNIEAECFYGYSASVEFSGTVIHPGSARGRLANALTMAGMFISMLPRNESPEATDGRYGFYCPLELKADMEFAKLDILLRDFDLAQIERRAEFLQSLADTVKKAFPGGEAKLSIKKSYSNMKQYIDENPEGLAILEEAVRKSGLEPSLKLIRGGTDGSRLSEMGIPCPNVFTGGYNYHSRKEWAALPAMARAAMTVVNLALLWAEKKA